MATDVISYLHVVVHIMKGGKFFNSSENKHTQTIKKSNEKPRHFTLQQFKCA